MKWGRRKAMAGIAGAPVALGLGVGGQPVDHTVGMVDKMPGLERSAFYPPGVEAFNKARRSAMRVYESRNRLMNTHVVIDANIDSLRSVSTQHKLRMQHDRFIKMQEEQDSLAESLARQFGVLDWWNSMKIES